MQYFIISISSIFCLTCSYAYLMLEESDLLMFWTIKRDKYLFWGLSGVNERCCFGSDKSAILEWSLCLTFDLGTATLINLFPLLIAMENLFI